MNNITFNRKNMEANLNIEDVVQNLNIDEIVKNENLESDKPEAENLEVLDYNNAIDVTLIIALVEEENQVKNAA